MVIPQSNICWEIIHRCPAVAIVVVVIHVTVYIVVDIMSRIIIILVIHTGSRVGIVVIIRRPVFRVCGTTTEYNASEYDDAHNLKKLA
jgi:hypothetical protein